MAGNVSGQVNRSQSHTSKTKGDASEQHTARARHRSPHGHHHHDHHAHSPHMEDIQKAELQARQEDTSKSMNGERGRDIS